MERTTDGHPTAGLAHLMLFLLFVCIEILPVMSKVLSSIGAPSLYERLVARHDDGADADDEANAAADRELVRSAADARLTLSRHRELAQIQAGKQATEELVNRQSRITMRAIQTWSDIAAMRAHRELQRWYRANIDPHISVEPAGRGQPHPNGHSPGPADATAAAQTIPIPRIQLPNPGRQNQSP